MDFGQIWETIAQNWRELDRSEKRLIIEFFAFLFILWQLKRSRKALERVVQNVEVSLRKRIDAVEDAVEAATAETPQTEADRWEEIRLLWRNTRDRIELTITDKIDDRRKLRKYNNFTRHNYRPIIESLRSDRKLKNQSANTLMQMNDAFLGLRRKRAASAADLVKFQDLYREADKDLSKGPDESSDE